MTATATETSAETADATHSHRLLINAHTEQLRDTQVDQARRDYGDRVVAVDAGVMYPRIGCTAYVAVVYVQL